MIALKVKVDVISQTPTVTPYLRAIEFDAGFVLFQPPVNNAPVPGPTFLWTLGVKVGEKGQSGCNKIKVGAAQSVMSYRAMVTWASGTTWLWTVAGRLPARDSVAKFDKPPWYNSDETNIVTDCGQTITVTHGDSPALIAQPNNVPTYKAPAGDAGKMIPWDDPLGRGKDSVRSCQWTAEFTAFIIAFDGHDVQKVTSVGWALSVALDFDMKQPVGNRSKIVIPANVAVVAPKAKTPIIKGPHATIKMSQHGSVAEATKVK